VGANKQEISTWIVVCIKMLKVKMKIRNKKILEGEQSKTLTRRKVTKIILWIDL